MNPISIHNCDVLVMGAGLEGCIAAIEAANKGKKVLLIENSGSFGEAATNGLYIHLPDNKNMTQKAATYVEYILNHAGDRTDMKKRIYHDQKLKVVLKQMLTDAGVQTLTHMFLVGGTVADNEIISYRICGKTGYIDVTAKQYVDATDHMEAGASLGLKTEEQLKEVKASLKLNQVTTEAIRQFAKTITEEGEGYFIGTADYPLVKEEKNITYTAEHLGICHDKDFKELIFTGLTAKLEKVNAVSLSNAQAGLRRFSYELRDELRSNISGFEKLNIIHVSPRIDCYGIKKVVENPYNNLILLNNQVKEYDNIEAVERGITGVKEI